MIVAAGTVACGLLMLGGVGPAVSGTRPVGDTVPALQDPSTTTTAVLSMTTVPATTTTLDPTTTTTVIPPSTTTAPPVSPPPVPLSVTPSTVTVGAGGVARISGTCPLADGVALGPVEIWEVGASVRVIPTGVTAAAWSYDWTAPPDPQPLVLQVWCGDPSGYLGGYPAALQIQVVFVAQEPATTTVAGGGVGIPETG